MQQFCLSYKPGGYYARYVRHQDVFPDLESAKQALQKVHEMGWYDKMMLYGGGLDTLRVSPVGFEKGNPVAYENENKGQYCRLILKEKDGMFLVHVNAVESDEWDTVKGNAVIKAKGVLSAAYDGEMLDGKMYYKFKQVVSLDAFARWMCITLEIATGMDWSFEKV